MEEFIGYYELVSMCYDKDKDFEEFVTRVWSVDELYTAKQKQWRIRTLLG